MRLSPLYAASCQLPASSSGALSARKKYRVFAAFFAPFVEPLRRDHFQMRAELPALHAVRPGIERGGRGLPAFPARRSPAPAARQAGRRRPPPARSARHEGKWFPCVYDEPQLVREVSQALSRKRIAARFLGRLVASQLRRRAN
jgi:hypothetical protein